MFERLRYHIARSLIGGTKASAAGSVIVGWQNGQVVSPNADLRGLTDEGYAKCVAVFTCVNKIASSMAGIPLSLFRDGEELDEDAEHPLLDLLKRPNPFTNYSNFFQGHFSYKLLSGNNYLERVTSGTGGRAVLELWSHRPDQMAMTPSPEGTPAKYILRANGRKYEWEVKPDGTCDLLHSKCFNPLDPWFGQPPLKAGINSMCAINDANKWNRSLLSNAAYPGGAFVMKPDPNSPGGLSDMQLKQLETQIEEKLSGPANARRPMIMGGGLEWQQISLSPQDMDWLNGKDSSTRDICNIFNVPPQMLGLKDAQTYANYAEARQSFYTETVIPLLNEFLDELNTWLCPMFEKGLVLKMDHDDLDALAPSRRDQWDKIAAADWLTVNEKRDATGYEEVEGGDVVLVSSTSIPLEAAGEPELGAEGAAVPGKPKLGPDGKPLLNPDGTPQLEQPAPALGPDGKPLPGAAGGSAGGVPAGSGATGLEGAAAMGTVQQAVLNGTQISSLQAIVQAVADGTMPMESAVQLVLISFPSIKEETVRKMLQAADDFEPPPPELPAFGGGGDGTANPFGGKPKPGEKPVPGAKVPKPGKNPFAKAVKGLLLQEGFDEETADEVARFGRLG